MNRKVIYTAIFGPRGNLQEPPVCPVGWDFICFTDRRELKCNIWQVCRQSGIYSDPARSAKIFKVLPHRYFAGYELSLWMDGNMTIRQSPDVLVEKYLATANLALFNHKENTFDSRDCVYDEAQALIARPWKDDPEVVRTHIERYRREGYPEHNGLAVCGVLLRRHMEADVVNAMELWWKEIECGSRRDQLSFNYVAWKADFSFRYIPGDLRNNEWFEYTEHETPSITTRVKRRLLSIGRKLRYRKHRRNAVLSDDWKVHR